MFAEEAVQNSAFFAGSGAGDYVAVPILKPGEATDKPEKLLEELRAEMLLLAEQLEFEQAAKLRDKIVALEAQSGGAQSSAGAKTGRAAARGKRSRRR